MAQRRRENLQLENDQRLIELYLLLAEVLDHAGEMSMENYAASFSLCLSKNRS